MSLAKAPKLARTPWQIGYSASRRVAEALAWMPTHSAEQWSTAMNTLAWPSPVATQVMSVPYISSDPVGGDPAIMRAGRPCALKRQEALFAQDAENVFGAGAHA